MTNEEAIEKLAYIKTHHTDPEDYELFDLAIKALEERPQGEWIRKEDVIHSIAKQYSEHNELVPIWLSVGNMKGGAE